MGESDFIVLEEQASINDRNIILTISFFIIFFSLIGFKNVDIIYSIECTLIVKPAMGHFKAET
jgi:hypothetical protein